MKTNDVLFFALQVDCESTQRAIRNPALGERAIRGLAEVMAATGTKGTFFVIPGDLETHAPIYAALETAGHEVGLHIHVEEPGGTEFLGDRGPDEQRRILTEAIDRFTQVRGRRPESFCPGYFSANDHTFGLLEELGFTHGAVSCPTRDLPACASVWGASSLDPRYPHRHNRMLDGDVDFVDLPVTIDPASRMWGGSHPLDLRVELVDAKNHRYTIEKSLKRQIAAGTPLKQLHALTHNVFEYGNPADFRRQTYVGMVEAAKAAAAQAGVAFRPATLRELADEFRRRAPRPGAPAADARRKKSPRKKS